MKKTIYQYSLIFLIASTILGACSKSFIEKSPFDSLPASEALTTADALQNALNGVYSQLRAVALFGRDFPVIGDLQADNTFIEARNSGRYINQYNYTLVSSDGVFSEIWNASYTGILRTNQIIDAPVTGGNVAEIKAQAYALRGLLYFKLVNIYARPYTDNPAGLGVPLVLHYDPYKLPARNTVQEVYTQIISDLKAGFQDAPEYESSVRISKYAIEGLLAKAYLYMGDNANAKTAAVDVINNSGFTLTGTAADYKAFWANSAIQSSKIEVMFEVDADVVNNNGFDDLAGIYENGYNDIYASQQLVSLYSATDIRRAVLIDGTTKNGAVATIVDKYPNAQSGDRDNLKVIRLAEVYLIAAEASVATNEADARNYLNLLLAKRDQAFPGYASSGTNLLNAIVQERRKELAFEGDRFYDLNRFKLNITRLANPGSINGPTSITYSDTKRIAPIPLGEIQSNANIAGQQNPGY